MGNAPNWADYSDPGDDYLPTVGTVYIYLSDLCPRDVPFGSSHVDFHVPVAKPGSEDAADFLKAVSRKCKSVMEGIYIYKSKSILIDSIFFS